MERYIFFSSFFPREDLLLNYNQMHRMRLGVQQTDFHKYPFYLRLFFNFLETNWEITRITSVTCL